MLLAQITDLHVALPGTLLDSRYRTSEHLQRAVAHLLGLDPGPDAVVITGDLVDAGSATEYERLVELLAPLTAPVYVIPGNHDEREAMRAAFGPRGYLPAEGFLCYAVDLGALRLVALDTNVPGEPGGALCAARLAWLDACLAGAPDRPTVVVLHHPPFTTGIEQMDGMGLVGADGLAEVIGRHGHVERVLCGHVHRPITRRFAGTVAVACPGTAHQIALDLRHPGGLAIVREPPACMLHVWSEQTGLVSHMSYVDPRAEIDVIYPPRPG